MMSGPTHLAATATATGAAASARALAGTAATAAAGTGRRLAPRITLTRYTAVSGHVSPPHGPRQIARFMLPHFHWGPHQFRYLDWLWSHESGWNRYAANPYSGAYGIPQAMPGGQMASAGRGWRWNAHTQIRWGMRYIRERYGSPRRAWQHETSYGWY